MPHQGRRNSPRLAIASRRGLNTEGAMSEVKRDERGRVVSGALNPGGRPKADHSVTDLAREHTPEAMEKIVDLMRNGETQKIQFDAAVYIVNRGWGTPHQ